MRPWNPGLRTTLTLICAACTGAVLLLHAVPPFTAGWWANREARAQDWLATNPAARRAAHHPQIIFLGRDSATISLDELMGEELKQSRALQLIRAAHEAQAPWSREVWALIAERLLEAGARVVIFDVTYPVPREGDEAFKATLERHADRIVIGSNLTYLVEETPTGQMMKKPQLELPSPTLLPQDAGDRRVGFVNVRADEDGLVRQVYFRTTRLAWSDLPPMDGIPEWLSLPAQALRQAGLEELIPPGLEPHRFRFTDPFPARSLYEIFVEDIWQRPPYQGGALFRDKIILIGASGNQAEDRLNTPLGTVLGPDIHLSTLNAALQRDFLHEASSVMNLAAILASGLVAWLLGAFVQAPRWRFALLLAAMLLYYAATQLAYNFSGLLPLLLSPLAALSGSGLTWIVWEQQAEQREKKRMRRTMERYLSKDLTKELIDNRESVLNALGGVRRSITILFSDVRGFTTITESAEDPAKLVAQLNEYFGEMVRIVFEQRGRLDKFIGDAVMAEWGGLEAISGGVALDARRAVAAALAMRRELARLNAGWQTRGMLELKFGIGVNHGEAIVGNLGSEEKMEVSAIGDAVNLASRLEGATKEYHLDLLLGEQVAPFVREFFILRTVDLLQVKGKTKPVEVFTALDDRAPGAADPAWLQRYEEGVRLYRQRAFTEAAHCFAEAAQSQPDDWLIGEYLQRCREYLTTAPPPEWDGVHVMTKK